MDERTASYTVLARRFRPQTFDEVVGQQPVAQALKNAIRADRVAHAYLFTGARGVGKTSMARILAKALNCPNTDGGVPCNACEICQGIATGHDVDVLEIDGASNNGVDDVRLLRSNVNIRSMRTRFKMYIIDEVHMLTRPAFNALLKTLEEPPPNVVFVFCTTEPNKVPDTILSRCQRFDFATIETQNIANRLAQIAESEGFDVEPAALDLVARRAAGSMRDSQSLFDQLLAFGEKRIGPDDVHRLLGTASDERLITLMDAVIDGDSARTLQGLNDALTSGVQLSEFVDQLLQYTRDLMVLAAQATDVALLSVSESAREPLHAQAERWGLSTILAALQVLQEAKSRMRQVTFGRVPAELALVRLCQLEQLNQLNELLDVLKGAPAAPASPATKPPATPANRSTASPTDAAGPSSPSQKPAGSPQKKTRDDAEPAEDAATTAVVTATRVELAPGNELQFLSQLLSSIDDMLMGHLKGVGRLAISGPNRVDLYFNAGYTFSKQYCEQPQAASRIEALASEIAGSRVRVRLLLDEAAGPETGDAERDVAVPLSAKRVKPPPGDAFVQNVMDLFEAKIVKVEGLASTGHREEN